MVDAQNDHASSQQPELLASAARAQRPTLSICVPTYKRPELVQVAIRSIIRSAAGAGSAVEIVVSDNSPEVSEQACREALAAWAGPSVYVGHSPNIGFNANYNQCIAGASGDYVLFVHDDDRLLPDAVPAILSALAAGGEHNQVLLFGLLLVDGAGRILRRQEFCRDAWVDAPRALRLVLSDNGFVTFPAIVVSREAYAAVGPYDAEVGYTSDLDMWVRLYARFGVRCVPRTISGYSVHAASTTQTLAIDGAGVANILNVFARARATGILPPRTIRRCQDRFLHEFILSAVFRDLQAGDVAGARTAMALFRLPAVRSLPPSKAWLPVRAVFAVLVRGPARVVRPLMRLVNRLDLVRAVRAVRRGGEGDLPLC